MCSHDQFMKKFIQAHINKMDYANAEVHKLKTKLILTKTKLIMKVIITFPIEAITQA